MVGVRHYGPSDYSTLTKWYRERGLTPPTRDILPKVGLVVDEVAMGFIYQTDSTLAILEGVIADSKALKGARKDAIKALGAALLIEARHMGYTEVIAFTESKTIADVCKNEGFTYSGDKQLWVF